jgi:5-formyltetrahydrofolate cyclo-ligase
MTLTPSAPPTPGTSDKARLRRQIRRARAAIPPLARAQAQATVCRALLRQLRGRRGRKLALYMAVGSELDPAALMTAARTCGVRLYLPQVPRRGRRMRFAPLDDPRGRWRRNRYGILEYHSRQHVSARVLDVVGVPLVGFDASGRRLGQGGGYYDTSFAFRRLRHHWRRPRLVGLAFELQRVPALATEPHDVTLDAVVTERGTYVAGRFMPHCLGRLGGRCRIR